MLGVRRELDTAILSSYSEASLGCRAFGRFLAIFEEWIEILYNVARTRTPRNTAEKQSETENLVHKLHSSFILYLVKQI
jgi:hypothetical protein